MMLKMHVYFQIDKEKRNVIKFLKNYLVEKKLSQLSRYFPKYYFNIYFINFLFFIIILKSLLFQKNKFKSNIFTNKRFCFTHYSVYLLILFFIIIINKQRFLVKFLNTDDIFCMYI